MTSRNLGKITILSENIRQSPDMIAEIFIQMRFIPVRAELMFHNKNIEYIGLSDRFNEIKEGEQIPSYSIEVVTLGDGEIEIKCQQI